MRPNKGSSYPLQPHRTATGGRDFKRRRNAEERHAGAGVPREVRGRRVGRKELRWARKEKKKEDKERKREKGEEGGVFDAQFGCLSTKNLPSSFIRVRLLETRAVDCRGKFPFFDGLWICQEPAWL